VAEGGPLKATPNRSSLGTGHKAGIHQRHSHSMGGLHIDKSFCSLVVDKINLSAASDILGSSLAGAPKTQDVSSPGLGVSPRRVACFAQRLCGSQLREQLQKQGQLELGLLAG